MDDFCFSHIARGLKRIADRDAREIGKPLFAGSRRINGARRIRLIANPGTLYCVCIVFTKIDFCGGKHSVCCFGICQAIALRRK